jgi:hypothetical protein
VPGLGRRAARRGLSCGRGLCDATHRGLVEDRAMSPVDLQQSAVAMWFLTLHKQGEAAPTRHFGSVAKAVRFVMEELEADARGTALIEVAGYGPLRSDEIASIYRELPSSIE